MLQIQNLTKRYPTKVLFDNMTCTLPHGEKIALIGQNGCGKTTLLNVICGLDEVDSGQIILASERQIGFLPQSPNPNPAPTILQETLSGHKSIYETKQKLEAAVETIRFRNFSTDSGTFNMDCNTPT